MRKLFRDERGQGMAVPVMMLVSLIGMTAFVVDVGAWFRADRHMQAVADAAALAAAQELPHDPGSAIATATDYAAKNGGPAAAALVVFKDKKPNDSIRVQYDKNVDGFFSRVFSIDKVKVGAGASARASLPSAARFVAPIVVNEKHPMLTCTPTPCFNQATTLSYHHLKNNDDGSSMGAGSFGFVDLTGEGTGTSELKKQISKGWGEMMPLGDYSARTGNPFSAIESDLQSRIGQELLFPVYEKLIGSGTNAEYKIIGWVGFVITHMDLKGSNEILYGHFTRVTWEGLPADDPDADSTSEDFGAFVVHLTK